MRILHVIQTLDPAWGGPPRVAARLAAAQAALGHHVTIGSYGDPTITDAVGQMTATIPGFASVHRRTIDNGSTAERLTGRNGGRIVRDLLGSQDVVHLHNVWEPVLLRAANAARAARMPYVVQPNGILDQWCMAQKRLKKRLALALGYRRMLNSASILLCGNNDEQAAIRLLGLRTPMANVPLNAVFPDEISALPPRGAFQKRWPALGGAPFIIFLGRLHFKKGLDFLADAFIAFARCNRTHHLVVVGHDEGAQADFTDRIARAGLTNRVHLTGALHGGAKWEAFADADAFTLPSRQEGFSIAITEALACGLPAIVSRECHFPEIAEAGAGVVANLDAQAIAAGFHAVLDDPAVRQRMADAARRLVQTRFNCRTMAEEVVYAYESALSQRSPPPSSAT